MGAFFIILVVGILVESVVLSFVGGVVVVGASFVPFH